VLVENFAPGTLDRMGLTWEYIHKTNPRMIVASVKGFGPGPYEDCKVYENVAQCAGGAASTTGFRDGPPLVTGAQIGDSGTGLHLAFGIVSALYQRIRTGRGQRVLCAMQDGVLNLARVKLRDQQRLTHGPLTEYSQYGEGIPFGAAVPRAGNDSGGGQPGWILKCKGWESDPDAYIYFITQAPVWGAICDLIGKPEWKTDPDYATPPARLPRLRHIFSTIEQWTMTKTKFEVMDISNARQVFDRRQSSEDVGFHHASATLATAWRAHRGNPRQGTRLQRCGDRRDQGIGRDHRCGERCARRGGMIKQ
jgi:formyl-CoA transferase